MNRLDRLQAILLQIQSKKVITAQEIADKFDISIRTVYRDIRALEEAGVPIGAEAGIGYFLDDNYNLPPVMFTHEEASALVVAGKLMPYLSDKSVQNAFEGALLKVKAVLNTEQKESLEILENTVKVYTGPSEKLVDDTSYLQEIQNALIHKKVVEIEYYSHYSQEFNIRTIEPVGLIFYAMHWHLIAFCRLRKDYRDFRLDRIQNFQPLNETFARNLGQAFEEYMLKEKEKVDYFEISIRFTNNVANYIRDSKYWYGFINEVGDADGMVMSFLNPDLDGFSRWLISLGEGMEIIKPTDLKDLVFERIRLLQKNFKK